MEQESISMEVVNPQAAGIDIGSRSHWVAVGQSEQDVPYINPEGYLFLDQKRKLGLVKQIKKQIDKFGLTNQDLGLEIGQI